MKSYIVSDIPPSSELPGRLRLRVADRLTKAQADSVERELTALPFISGARASHITGSVIIYYDTGFKNDVLDAVSGICAASSPTARADSAFREYKRKMTHKLFSHIREQVEHQSFAAILPGCRRAMSAYDYLGQGFQNNPAETRIKRHGLIFIYEVIYLPVKLVRHRIKMLREFLKLICVKYMPDSSFPQNVTEHI